MKSFKLWKWIFEFKLKRVRDEEKVIFLANQLLKEMAKQGVDLKNDTKMVCIYVYNYEGNRGGLCVQETDSRIEYKGKYEGVIK